MKVLNRILVQLLLFSALAVPSSFAAGVNAASSTMAANQTPKELQDIGINENLGGQVSLGALHFKDEQGKTVSLQDFAHPGKPVLLTLVYYECPMLCNLVLNGLLDTLKVLDWTPGKQFEIVAVSINPKETPELAAKKKASYLKALGRPEIGSGWHFLTGEEDQIRQLASEVGFRYKKEGTEYAHGAALYVLTPQGKISRYLYGIEFPKLTMKLSLLEASDGKIGTVVDRFLLFCYRYDPQTRKYSVYLERLVRAGGAFAVMILGAFLVLSWRRERQMGMSV